MRKLRKPIDDVEQVYRTCISLIRNVDLKQRLEEVVDDIVAAAADYEAAASTTRLHTIPIQDHVGRVSKWEMSDVYTKRMARKGRPGRPLYDKLLAAPEHGRCPLCGQGMVSTLDHHLPKDHYPALTVVPVNLIPSCALCNKSKINTLPMSVDEQTLHPYYDDFEDEQWLYAEVLQGSPVVLRYYVDPPTNWNIHKAERVRHHFKVFKLAVLYASYAADELVSIRLYLERLYNQAGSIGVNIHLQCLADSYGAAHTNSWQTAMYKALASNNWYCRGGLLS